VIVVDLQATARFLASEGQAPPDATSFLALDYLLSPQGLILVGKGAGRSQPWAGAVVARSTGGWSALPRPPTAELHLIRRTPGGRTMAAGDGLFELVGGRWSPVWRYSKR
jgi:hypothetical protein